MLFTHRGSWCTQDTACLINYVLQACLRDACVVGDSASIALDLVEVGIYGKEYGSAERPRTIFFEHPCQELERHREIGSHEYRPYRKSASCTC